MLSNYDLQPLVSSNLPLEKATTTNSPILTVTRAPASFQKLFSNFPPESFKTALPTFQKLKLKPSGTLKQNPNHLTQSALTNEQIQSIFGSGSFTSLEELEDMVKYPPPSDHMFGLPKVAPKKQNHFEHQHEQLPHNFHTQLPHMMPFNNHGMMTPQTSANSGSFITELNNLFSKHLTRARPGNFLPSSSRPPPTISLHKFSPNALASWFNKPKDMNNANLLASSSHHSYPAFADPPPPPTPPPQLAQQPKWGIFTSITKFFHAPSAPQSTSSNGVGMRPQMEHNFNGMNQMQTAPLNFYQHQPPPRIQFRPLSMVQNVTRPAF